MVKVKMVDDKHKRFEENDWDFWNGRLGSDVRKRPFEIDEDRLVFSGGGDFSDYDGHVPEPTVSDPDVINEANRLAKKYGMVITNIRGDWWGYSEYTPEPGDVSIFEWKRDETKLTLEEAREVLILIDAFEDVGKHEHPVVGRLRTIYTTFIESCNAADGKP